MTDNGTPPRSDTVTFTITVLGNGAPISGVTPPFIYAISSPNGQVTFSIQTTVGQTYRVLYKDELSQPAWIQLDRDFVAANPYASITDTIPRSQRFYQVQLVQ